MASTTESNDTYQPTMTTYAANCHCGRLRYKVTLPDALAPKGRGKINKYNCSICTKNGSLLVYHRREDVEFKDGCDTKLKDYYFGLKNKPHRSCPECSSSIMIDFKNSDQEGQTAFLAINARMFKGIDLDAADYSTFDGRALLGPKYAD